MCHLNVLVLDVECNKKKKKSKKDWNKNTKINVANSALKSSTRFEWCSTVALQLQLSNAHIYIFMMLKCDNGKLLYVVCATYNKSKPWLWQCCSLFLCAAHFCNKKKKNQQNKKNFAERIG